MKIICKLSRAEQRCQRSRPKTFYSFYRLSFFFLSRFVYVLFFPHSALANQTTVHSDINRSHSTDIGNENKNRIENNDDGDGKRLYDEMKTWIEYKMRKCRIETDALSISPSSFIVFFFFVRFDNVDVACPCIFHWMSSKTTIHDLPFNCDQFACLLDIWVHAKCHFIEIIE